jgi:hypothetical protein
MKMGVHGGGDCSPHGDTKQRETGRGQEQDTTMDPSPVTFFLQLSPIS